MPESNPPPPLPSIPFIKAPPLNITPEAEKQLNAHGYTVDDVTKEMILAVTFDIRKFVQNLNGIISRRDYNKWVSYLSSEYFLTISSKEFLDAQSQKDLLRTKKIVLKSAKDYFIYVVVPSRAQSRVDDIEFISETRVKAYTVNRGQRMRLYELERKNDSWLIAN
ncbi:hypothetical protein FACS1894190_07660 [Spirochaetia bacterium]|nr:hypothetical protein FACS1894190_07660 [Spirochaetia bacterium]GHV19619.1 hypothetical protein FACS189494_01700 [Spirochaetia bacterium]